MKPRREYVQGGPNGCRRVSIVADRVHPHVSHRYVIDLDRNLWAQTVAPGETGPWTLEVEARPLRRTPEKRKASKVSNKRTGSKNR